MRGTAMPKPKEQQPRTRLLIIEQDEHLGRRMVEALGRICEEGDESMVLYGGKRQGICGGCSCDPEGGPRRDLLHSLRDLYEFDLTLTDIVLCSANLPDGSGLDAIAYVRGIRPDLSVVLTGQPGESDLAVEAIRAGAVDFLITSGLDLRTLRLAVGKCLAHQRIKRENERLQADLSHSLAELAMKNQQLHAMISQLESMARTDDLTGLANRRWLNLMLDGYWADAARNDLPLACMMIDLDSFKPLNDRFGHQQGDEVLRLVGKVIEANCRTVDTCARYGGDEFCILMPHTEAAEAMQVAQRILREFDVAVGRMLKDESCVSVSIGISQIDLSRPISADQLVNHADEALYAAKSAGKARVMLRCRNGVRPVSIDEHHPAA